MSGVDLSRTFLKNADMNGAILCHTRMRGGDDNTGCK
ncbi:MAG: pentapeptide repeat-containing protein [Alphaproteobacteria bacterium]